MVGNVVARNDMLAFPQVGQSRKNVVPNYGIPVFRVVDDEDSRLTTRSLGTWPWQCWCASPCSCRWLRHACNSCSRERGLSFLLRAGFAASCWSSGQVCSRCQLLDLGELA